MPLSTQIERDGKLLSLRWGNYHIAAMVLATSFDSDGPYKIDHIYDIEDTDKFNDYPNTPFPVSRQLAFMLTSYPMIGKTKLNDGEYTLTKAHKFIDNADGEILDLMPGDILRAYRD